jgi:hypothetical protein
VRARKVRRASVLSVIVGVIAGRNPNRCRKNSHCERNRADSSPPMCHKQSFPARTSGRQISALLNVRESPGSAFAPADIRVI